MPVPRNRLSNARKNSRRGHHAKVAKQSSTCKNCNTLKLPHVACPSCGMYGKVVVKTAE